MKTVNESESKAKRLSNIAVDSLSDKENSVKIYSAIFYAGSKPFISLTIRCTSSWSSRANIKKS